MEIHLLSDSPDKRRRRYAAHETTLRELGLAADVIAHDFQRVGRAFRLVAAWQLKIWWRGRGTTYRRIRVLMFGIRRRPISVGQLLAVEAANEHGAKP